MTRTGLAVIFSIGLCSITSCGTAGKEKGVKGKWLQTERVEFMKNCTGSAKESFEKRGMAADTAMITTLCRCAGEIIEEKYGPQESVNLPAAESKAIMQQAAEKCLKTPKSE